MIREMGIILLGVQVVADCKMLGLSNDVSLLLMLVTVLFALRKDIAKELREYRQEKRLEEWREPQVPIDLREEGWK